MNEEDQINDDESWTKGPEEKFIYGDILPGLPHEKDDIWTKALEEDDANSEWRVDDGIHGALARQMRQRARIVSIKERFQNLFLGDNTIPPLDPTHKLFSSEAWLANLISLLSNAPNRNLGRSAGFSLKNLHVYGTEDPDHYQKTVANFVLGAATTIRTLLRIPPRKVQILHDFNALVEAGEMLLVLGRPGSGCTTFLKTIAGDTYGISVDTEAEINYQGISPKQMHGHFRGERIYMAETDVHFPQLTVGQTLLFAAKARAPRDDTIPGVTREMYARHLRDVIMAVFGLTHTKDTNVGNEFIKGVSGGERKRVSIAEAALSGSCLQCYDNSTRGLDSANALEFCKTLRLSSNLVRMTACVSLYQGPQSIYDLFDKVTVLYEGHQIFFGRCDKAKAYFLKMGFDCPPRQNTADFLTSLTNPAERDRLIRPGFEGRTPRTVEEFVELWKTSREYAKLRRDIKKFNVRYPFDGPALAQFAASKREQQARHQRPNSPYILSLSQQVGLCVGRGFQLLRRDATVTISRVVANSVMALVISSIFYNLQPNTDGFYGTSVLIFFASLFNAFASALEILLLFAQRPIVEKQARYAFYQPTAEAIASSICDLPYKLYNSIFFNLILYFMTNLRRTPGAFFTFWLFMFMTTLTVSMFYRTIGASSRNLAQALTPAAILNLAFMLYVGFAIPFPDMVKWFQWINYINPIAYSFQALMVNEYQGRTFECSSFVPQGPAYANIGPFNHICTAVGAVAGSNVVSGDDYLRLTFNYYPGQVWRNLGILCIFTLFFICTYLFATETVAAQKSKGEILLFHRNHKILVTKEQNDIERGGVIYNTSAQQSRYVTAYQSRQASAQHSRKSSVVSVNEVIHRQKSIVQWRDVCFDIKIKKETRRLLEHIDGYVKPGTLTALMGPSGAGKTTLFDVLATRNTIGEVSGEILVDGHQRDSSFQRKTGYVQQQDIHLETCTVREALRFSAKLRQPAHTSTEDKYAYVEEVIKLLDMEGYADAVISVPGEGLNVEQRKKLSIAIEIAAKPELLLFLDEPTSGLDSQTSWAILQLLEMLNEHGQAILCTIHQPSAPLFQKFHRLLFLGPNGKTVYFGELGPDSSTMIQYFERYGAKPCPKDANPAEWMMEVIGCTPGSHSDVDWPQVWRNSPEYALLQRELDQLRDSARPVIESDDKRAYEEFAAPFSVQLSECMKRINAHYWSSPSYIYSKTALCLLTGLFLGFSLYKSPNSLQGLQNNVFAIFMMIAIIACNFVPQILPSIITQRNIFESRERPAKVYSWQVFMLSNIFIELPWNTLMSVLVFVTWYYPIGLYRNAQVTDSLGERSGTMFLFIWVFFVYISTFAQFIMAGFELAEMAGNLANCAFLFALMFCGILATPTALPGFWIWMYRLSPFTYLVSSLFSVGFANAPITCSYIELRQFQPALNTTCGEYMAAHISYAGGYLVDAAATAECKFCELSNTDVFLNSVNIKYGDRWRNFGILWVYVLVNVLGAMGFYWLARVPKKGKVKKSAKS